MTKTKPVVLHIPTDQPFAIVVLPLQVATPRSRRAKRRPLDTTAEVVSECVLPLANVAGNVIPFRKVG